MESVRKGSIATLGTAAVVATCWAACGDTEPSNPVVLAPMDGGGTDVVFDDLGLPDLPTCTGEDSRSCPVDNGEGEQTRICDGGTWGPYSECVLVQCDPGYVEAAGQCQPQGSWTSWSDWAKSGRCAHSLAGGPAQRFIRTRTCQPAGHVCVGDASESVEKACMDLKVMTFNIHGGMDRDPFAKHQNGESLDALVALIKAEQVDLALLQEVQQDGWYYHRFQDPVYRDQIAFLQNQLLSDGYAGVVAKYRDQTRYAPDTNWGSDDPPWQDEKSGSVTIRDGTHNVMTLLSSRVNQDLVHNSAWSPGGGSWWDTDVLGNYSSATYENVRRALTVKLYLPDFEPLVVINLHIVPHAIVDEHLNPDRVAEKRLERLDAMKLQSVAAEQQYPAVVAGDFNLMRTAAATQQDAWGNPAYLNAPGTLGREVEEFGAEEYGIVTTKPGVGWGFNDPAYQCNSAAAMRKVDFLFYKRMACANYRVLDPQVAGTRISDHRPLIVNFHLSPLPPP